MLVGNFPQYHREERDYVGIFMAFLMVFYVVLLAGPYLVI
jgi:hypothetical protein